MWLTLRNRSNRKMLSFEHFYDLNTVTLKFNIMKFISVFIKAVSAAIWNGWIIMRKFLEKTCKIPNWTYVAHINLCVTCMMQHITKKTDRKWNLYEILKNYVFLWNHLDFEITWNINEPQHDKTNKMTYVPNKDSDQSGHPPILNIVFTDRMKKLTSERTAKTDQTGWIPRLIRVSAGRTSFCWFCHAATQIRKESMLVTQWWKK